MATYDGNQFYGVKRDLSIRIYRRGIIGVSCILRQPGQMTEFEGLIADCGEDRAARDRVMAEFVKFGG